MISTFRVLYTRSIYYITSKSLKMGRFSIGVRGKSTYRSLRSRHFITHPGGSRPWSLDDIEVNETL